MPESAFAYHPPGQGNAYVAPQGIRDRFAGTSNAVDPFMSQVPDNMDARTGDVLYSPDRLSGARGVPGLKERDA